MPAQPIFLEGPHPQARGSLSSSVETMRLQRRSLKFHRGRCNGANAGCSHPTGHGDVEFGLRVGKLGQSSSDSKVQLRTPERFLRLEHHIAQGGSCPLPCETEGTRERAGPRAYGRRQSSAKTMRAQRFGEFSYLKS